MSVTASGPIRGLAPRAWLDWARRAAFPIVVLFLGRVFWEHRKIQRPSAPVDSALTVTPRDAAPGSRGDPRNIFFTGALKHNDPPRVHVALCAVQARSL